MVSMGFSCLWLQASPGAPGHVPSDEGGTAMLFRSIYPVDKGSTPNSLFVFNFHS